jgi:phage terminase large subunit-like protein
MYESFFIGLDLGQSRDFTAIAIVERAVLKKEYDAAVWSFRKPTVRKRPPHNSGL